MRELAIVISILGLSVLAATSRAHQEHHHHEEAATPEETVDAFHHTLAEGKRDMALSYLSPEVVIFESGGAEMSREKYASHHLGSDMEYSAAVQRTVVDRRSESHDKVAWVLTRTATRGTFRDREIDSQGTETMVLHESADGWQIVHIHWSSRPTR